MVKFDKLHLIRFYIIIIRFRSIFIMLRKLSFMVGIVSYDTLIIIQHLGIILANSPSFLTGCLPSSFLNYLIYYWQPHSWTYGQFGWSCSISTSASYTLSQRYEKDRYPYRMDTRRLYLLAVLSFWNPELSMLKLFLKVLSLPSNL